VIGNPRQAISLHRHSLCILHITYAAGTLLCLNICTHLGPVALRLVHIFQAKAFVLMHNYCTYICKITTNLITVSIDKQLVLAFISLLNVQFYIHLRMVFSVAITTELTVCSFTEVQVAKDTDLHVTSTKSASYNTMFITIYHIWYHFYVFNGEEIMHQLLFKEELYYCYIWFIYSLMRNCPVSCWLACLSDTTKC